MKRSVNEIHGMVLKAGRGAGLPLGCAEDLANATAHLARRSPQHLGEVLMALEAPHEAPAMTRELVNARVATAVPVAIDHVMITEQPIRFSGIDAPHLLRSYVECAASLRAVSLALSTDNVLSLGGPAAKELPPIGSVEVDDSLWGALAKLAHRTYVPASEASRVAGAGAGLTDND